MHENIFEKIKLACHNIEKTLEKEPGLVLCESELQILLHLHLLHEFPETCEAYLNKKTIGTSDITGNIEINRVYREINIIYKGGRNSPKPDLLVLENRKQEILPKRNGAPSTFRPPFSAIIETKTAVDWKFNEQKNIPKQKNIIKDIYSDIDKYYNGNNKIIEGDIFFIVLTPYPEIYNFYKYKDAFIIPIKYPTSFSIQRKNHDDYDFNYQENLLIALKTIHDNYKKNPLLMLREKDFETHLVHELRKRKFPYAPVVDSVGEIIGHINPIRSQWITKNYGARAQNRRHDIIILNGKIKIDRWGPSQYFLPAWGEIELKTSHSMNFNWFTKNSLMKELSIMQEMALNGDVRKSIFVMFRYGDYIFEKYAMSMQKNFPDVDIYYLASTPNSKTLKFVSHSIY